MTKYNDAIKFDENQSRQNRIDTNKAEIEKLKEQNKNDDFSKYTSMHKSWEKVHKRIAVILKLAQELEMHCKKVVETLKLLNEALIEVFYTAPKVDDPNFARSLLGPSKVWFYLKVHLIKLGLKELGHIHNVHTMKGFVENMRDSLSWLTKLEKGDQLYGTAAERAAKLNGDRANINK